MQCQHAQELFSDYISGEIERAMQVGLENHLASCTDCKEGVTTLRSVWASLDELPMVEPPMFFHENLMSRIAAQETEKEQAMAQKKALWDWKALFRPRTLAFGAATLLLFLTSVEVVQTRRATMGPIGWLAGIISPAAPSPVALQSPQAVWKAEGASSGTITVTLRAAPRPDGKENRLTYRLMLPGQETPMAKGVLSSEQETTLTLFAPSTPANQRLSLMLSAPDSETSGTTVLVPVEVPPTAPQN